jgi:hypothetical protein
VTNIRNRVEREKTFEAGFIRICGAPCFRHNS